MPFLRMSCPFFLPSLFFPRQNLESALRLEPNVLPLPLLPACPFLLFCLSNQRSPSNTAAFTSDIDVLSDLLVLFSSPVSLRMKHQKASCRVNSYSSHCPPASRFPCGAFHGKEHIHFDCFEDGCNFRGGRPQNNQVAGAT